MWVVMLLSLLKANAVLDKCKHLMLIEYSINEQTKDKGIVYVDILFHHNGKTYVVARHRYQEPITSIVDTFPWISMDKWEGGDLEVVARKVNGSIERSYISEKMIAVKDLGYESPKVEHEVNSVFVKLNNGSDPYAWRMLGYDAGHTGYYPFHLYPPLDSLWMYRWSGAGTWTTEISGAAGHGMIFIPEAPWGWNKIQARDIETGEVIWERVVTANVWTSVLSEGDSVLFVGTSIGFTPWQDTTFYALDPFTGKLKWGKVLKTVEYSPIVVDSFVYAPHFYKVYCFTYEGDSVWAGPGAYSSPVYEDGIIIGAATDSILNARDYLTGELLWDFVGSGRIYTLMAYEGKLIFSPLNEPLYALNTTNGQTIWTNWDYPLINRHPPQAGFETIFIAGGHFINDTTIISHIYFINSIDGTTIWDSAFFPIPDAWGGGATRLLITLDSLLWYAKTDALYLLRVEDHSVFFFMPFPSGSVLFTSNNFPIFYKNYFIYAHEDFLVVYEADTVFHDTAEDSLPSLSNLKVYGGITIGQLHLEIDLPEKSWVNLKIFDILGRELVTLLNDYLMRGRHSLSFDLQSLPTGVYFLRAEIKGEKRENIVRKFLVLR
ncbi:MAG: hypothetical protein DRJ45_09635 [Thermoprotei archaeon]|nr:MAG: hypothetical protein DRJ45_09635 [Thermoprotei archaeon]